MPTQIYNTYRMAAGDTSSNASTNNAAVTATELSSFLANYAGGTIASGASVPNGIYVPIDNQSSKNPTGGIYVQGDARIAMNVVQGQSDFSTTQWNQMQTADRTCKFQKFSITSLTAGVTARDIYIGADPCYVTYVYDATNTSNTPIVVNGRLNGVVHVNGAIDELGGASRTRPAVAQDFQMTIAALKDVKIKNDIQYEDVQYKTISSSGTLGSSVVANAYGAVNSSGIANTAANVGPTMASDSLTVLGIISTQKSIYIHTNAPNDINLQAALFAGNSAAYNSSTGLGCGSSYAGCGFGVENYSTAPNKGQIKYLGSLAEFRDQTTGSISGSTLHGYSQIMLYDTRLRQTITPPAYPTSGVPRATGTVKPYKTFRISAN
jgi:hypothetical protein